MTNKSLLWSDGVNFHLHTRHDWPKVWKITEGPVIFLERAVGRNSPYSFKLCKEKNQWHHPVTIHLALEHGSLQTKSTVWIITVLRSSHANNLQLVALSEAWKIQEMGPRERKLGHWGHALEGDVGAPVPYLIFFQALWGEHVSPCIVLSCHDLLRLSKGLIPVHKVPWAKASNTTSPGKHGHVSSCLSQVFC